MTQKEENTPQYIKQVPWYAQDSQGRGDLIKIPNYEPKGFLTDWYERGTQGFQASNFRKGACQNCGAMGHKKKDCTERPRKLGAKFTNSGIAKDDIVKELKMNWQVKRDRWNGYVPEMYKQVIEEYNQLDELRKKVKTEGEDVDELRNTSDPLAVAGLPTKQAKNQKFLGIGGVRNRQDRAKYLNNLDVNSAHFDPKSRTLDCEDNWESQLNNLDVLGQKGDLNEQDRFAFEQVQKHHAELSSTALPTLTEKIYKSVKHKREGINSGKMGQIIRKYGAQGGPGRLQVLCEEQDFREPNKNAQQRRPKSKYEEDVFPNDHTSVWGSWYNPFLGWGYHCCYSNQKLSYCAGIKGRERATKKIFRIKTQQLKNLKLIDTFARQGDNEDFEQVQASADKAEREEDQRSGN